jgi:hypothetical protein
MHALPDERMIYAVGMSKIPQGTKNDNPANMDKATLKSLEQSAREAASRAAEYAHATMKPSGHWLCELRSTVSFTAQYIVLRTILATTPLSKEEQIKLRLWIESQQDCSGCWGLLPKEMGEGHLSTTAEAYLALKLLGVRSNEPHMQAARQFILDGGGLSKIGVTTQLLLALLGLVAWSELPQVPPELMLLPNSGPFFNIFSLAYWARTAAVPIIILRHHQPIYHGIVPTNFLDELWVDAQHRHITYNSSLGQSWHNGELNRFMGSIADKSLGLLEPGLRLLPTRSSARGMCTIHPRPTRRRWIRGFLGFQFWCSTCLESRGISSEAPSCDPFTQGDRKICMGRQAGLAHAGHTWACVGYWFDGFGPFGDWIPNGSNEL